MFLVIEGFDQSGMTFNQLKMGLEFWKFEDYLFCSKLSQTLNKIDYMIINTLRGLIIIAFYIENEDLAGRRC